MKSYWNRVGPYSNMTGVLIRKEHTHTYTHTEQPCEDTGTQREDGGRDWHQAVASQGMPRIASNLRS